MFTTGLILGGVVLFFVLMFFNMSYEFSRQKVKSSFQSFIPTKISFDYLSCWVQTFFIAGTEVVFVARDNFTDSFGYTLYNRRENQVFLEHFWYDVGVYLEERQSRWVPIKEKPTYGYNQIMYSWKR